MVRYVCCAGTRLFAAGLVAVCLAVSVAAQEKPKPTAPAQQMSAAEKAMMDAMTAAMTPGEPHKLLASLAGEWAFTMTMWTSPGAPPETYHGTGTYTPILGGRYVQSAAKGVMMGMPFEGMGINAYDNVTKRFVSSWIDNFGTGIITFAGTQDAATKTITYTGEMADLLQPTAMVKVRELLRFVDANTHVMEWYETRGGKEVKTMQIDYVRKK